MILSGLFAVVSVSALGLLPTSCQSGGIGDPCIPEDEFSATFNGFKVTEDNIESRSFQCESRICLVNHFQGRVSCPLGQPAPEACSGPGAACTGGGSCTEAATYAPYCDKDNPCPSGFSCKILNKEANKQGNFCACDNDNACPTSNGSYKCDAATQQCKSYVCHGATDASQCQNENNTPEQNAGKPCCVPGTADPVSGAVCGQCEEKSTRDAKDAVYCSCRCGVAEGAPEEPNFHFCDCPDGFSCTEIRRDLGIGDKQLSGKYCIHNDTATTPSEAATKCKSIVKGGFFSSGGVEGTIKCDGTPSL